MSQDISPDALAALHARAFATPPPWSAAAFAGLLQSPLVFLTGGPQEHAFALGRVVAGEAELLTLATAPEARRQGRGRGQMAAFEAEARARGAVEAFLEVAEDNDAARALYAGLGWEPRGRRPGYYVAPSGHSVAALILCKSLA